MPLLAKFITSMPWWQTEVQTLQEMHFFFSGENAVAGEARVDVHQRRERAGEPAPDAAAEPEVESDPEDAAQSGCPRHPGVIRKRACLRES